MSAEEVKIPRMGEELISNDEELISSEEELLSGKGVISGEDEEPCCSSS